MPVAYQFANASTTIPLSQLDANFASPITLGNTSIQLGNTVSTIGNLTLSNVTITSGNIAFAIPATSGGTGLVSPGTTGNVLTSNGTAWVSTGVSVGSGVTAISFGSTGLTPSTSTSGNVTVSGTLSANSGGTGLSSLTANSVLLGNGTSTIQFVSPGLTGNVLTSDGTTWASTAFTSAGGLTLVTTLTPAASATSVSVTGLATYKSFIIVPGSISLNVSAALVATISSNNGSTYSSNIIFTNNSIAPAGYAQIFKTDDSSSAKPWFIVGASSTVNAGSASGASGVINAIKISLSVASSFSGAGNIYIYGLN